MLESVRRHGKATTMKAKLTPRPGVTRELEPFLGDVRPVELASRVLDWRRDGDDVVISVATQRYEPEWVLLLGSAIDTVPDPTPGRVAELRVSGFAEGVIRFRYSRAGAPAKSAESPMLIDGGHRPVGPVVEQTESEILIAYGETTLAVALDPMALEVRDATGRTVWRSRPERMSFQSTATEFQRSVNWFFMTRYAHPLGLTADDGTPSAFISMELGHDEHVVGLGESFGPVDRRGTAPVLWTEEVLSNSSTQTYKPIPFFLSSAGYGFFLHTTNPARVAVGERDSSATSVLVEGVDALDWFVIVGPEPRRIIERYTSITGRPAIPPRWTFGLWMSRLTYKTQDEVLDIARRLREQRIPADVIHVDVGWFEHEWVCDYVFDPVRFPDPEGMLRQLSEMGFRLSLWQWPFLKPGSAIFEEAQEAGVIVTDDAGEPLVMEGMAPIFDVALLDYTNPATIEFMRAKIRPLLDMGVAAIKVDFGEAAPVSGTYAGADGLAAHNLYPLLYNRAMWSITEEAKGDGEAVIWARSAWAGSQRYPVHWAGDGTSRTQDLACVLRSMLSMSFSGFAFYSHDLGGHIGTPSPRTYVRWAQLGFFTSHVRCHGSPPREPWAFGDEAETIFRRYAELRYRLLPYIWGQARSAARDGAPLVRALSFEFPDDPSAWHVEDAFMLGESLLVAPVLDERDERLVYLPKGDWVDFWTGEHRVGGGWTEERAPLDHVPLFIRGGSALVMGPVLQHVEASASDDWEVRLAAPTGAGSLTFDGAGATPVDMTWQVDDDELRVGIGPSDVAVHLRLDMPIAEASVDGRSVTYEPAGCSTTVRVPAAHERQDVILRLSEPPSSQ
jgi:alpha-D-xyloside xylohydrolase